MLVNKNNYDNSSLTNKYLATFARIPILDERLPFQVKVNNAGEIDPAGSIVTRNISEKDISNAVQNANRQGITTGETRKLNEARATGDAKAYDRLAPSQVDTVDRKFRGRQSALNLDADATSNAFNSFLNADPSSANERLQRATSKLGKSTTLGDVFTQSRNVQDKDVIKQARRLEDFYSKVQAGEKVKPEEMLVAREALTNLVRGQRDNALRATTASEKISPLQKVLDATRDLDLITRQASPQQVKLDPAASKRAKDAVSAGTVPSFLRSDSSGNIDTKNAIYSPVVRAPGEDTPLSRRAGLLESVRDKINKADGLIGQGDVSASINDDILYTLIGINRPKTRGEQITELKQSFGERLDNMRKGIEARRAARLPQVTAPTSPIPQGIPGVPSRNLTKKKRKPNNSFRANVKLPDDRSVEASLEVPDFIRNAFTRRGGGNATDNPKVKLGNLEIPANIQGNSVIDTIRERSSDLINNPTARTVAAGGLGLTGLGILGGTLLSGNRRQQQLDRQAELEAVADRPPVLPQNQLPLEPFV